MLTDFKRELIKEANEIRQGLYLSLKTRIKNQLLYRLLSRDYVLRTDEAGDTKYHVVAAVDLPEDDAHGLLLYLSASDAEPDKVRFKANLFRHLFSGDITLYLDYILTDEQVQSISDF
jgi:hypothetical protein